MVSFDDRLQYFFKTIDEVADLAMVKDQECIRLHMEPLATAVKKHAKQWIECYGTVLRDSGKSGLYSLKQDIEVSIISKKMKKKSATPLQGLTILLVHVAI